jgi:hypothetical protein
MASFHFSNDKVLAIASLCSAGGQRGVRDPKPYLSLSNDKIGKIDAMPGWCNRTASHEDPAGHHSAALGGDNFVGLPASDRVQ